MNFNDTKVDCPIFNGNPIRFQLTHMRMIKRHITSPLLVDKEQSHETEKGTGYSGTWQRGSEY
jgi:hypothetical protein